MAILSNPTFCYVAITITCWITYGYTLFRCGFVSDDMPGIAGYDGKLQGKEYGMISRWLRYHICGGDFPSGKIIKTPDGKDLEVPCGKLPWRHHFLSLLIFNLATVSTYIFLSHIVSPIVAFLAVLLFIVHPLGTQCVAWISGLGYILSLFWVSLSLNLLHWFYQSGHDWGSLLLAVLLFCLIDWLAINALFIALMLPFILAYLGYWLFVGVALVISIWQGLRIVKVTIGLRVSAFKEQAMGESTYLNLRKPIVAVKTLVYYVAHCLVPARMGLYHKFGYHYERSLEKEDRMFLVGLVLIGVVASIFFHVPFTVQFGILWFISFLCIFLNWVTIQQFVTERYGYVPSLGLCLIIAYYTQNAFWLYSLIFGLYLMRTWMHLPTYENEIKFYQSNVWNFPNSEVAYGNLGVAYLQSGLLGCAIDSWNMATVINKDYDVPFYNLYFQNKTNAMLALQQGRFMDCLNHLRTASDLLGRCINAKVCHFKETWTKEYQEISNWLSNPGILISGEKKRLEELRDKLVVMRSEAKEPMRIMEVEKSIHDCNQQLLNINNLINPPSQLAQDPNNRP